MATLFKMSLFMLIQFLVNSAVHLLPSPLQPTSTSQPYSHQAGCSWEFGSLRGRTLAFANTYTNGHNCGTIN